VAIGARGGIENLPPMLHGVAECPSNGPGDARSGSAARAALSTLSATNY